MNNMKKKKFLDCVIGFPDAIGLTSIHGRPILNPIPPDTDIPYRCRRRICFMTPLNALLWLICSNTFKSRNLYNALSRTFLTLDRADIQAVLAEIQATHPRADLKPTTTSAVDAPTLSLIVRSNPQAVPSSSSLQTIPRDIIPRDTHPAYTRAHTKSP